MTALAGVDFSPLSADPTEEDLAELERAVRAGELGESSRRGHISSRKHGAIVFALIGGFLGLIFGIFAIVALLRDNREDAVIGGFFTAGILLVAAALGWVVSRSAKRSWERTWRLVMFARANGFTVEPTAPLEILPGSIFTSKEHAATRERLSWTVGDTHIEVANHTRNAGTSSFRSRYLGIRLDDPVPRAAFRCGVAGIPAAGIAGTETEIISRSSRRRRPRRGKLISKRANVDALRELFTEEVTDLLLDDTHPCNAETAGGWLFVYYHPGHRVDESALRHSVALADAVVRATHGRRRTGGTGR